MTESKSELKRKAVQDNVISRQAAIDAFDDYILDEVTDAHGDTVRTILERLPFITHKNSSATIITV